ncbi:hypothetical protein FSP39_016621 [Pinctada imbricata]|uniref:Uncharacterized protein n=1 Tax=Pinctada imbricata TaxID=66713 RepID=A0AA88XMQ2_PINIB|nr:hypothetical protein FSP39_016621 [Pinctada imbricata]
MFKDTKSELLCDSTRILQNLTDQISCAVDSESKFANLITPSISIKKTALGLIGIGMVLQGIGKSPRTTAFLLYVDDNADRRKTGFYGGIAVMFSIFGPALSYGLGGVFSRMYVTLEDVDMNPRDPRWIGAWWLGFLVFGSASFILSTVLLCFPRRLQQSGKEKAKGKKIIRTEEFEGTLKEKIKAGTHLSSVALGAFFGGLVTRKIQMTPRNGYKVLSILFVIHNTLDMEETPIVKKDANNTHETKDNKNTKDNNIYERKAPRLQHPQENSKTPNAKTQSIHPQKEKITGQGTSTHTIET